MNRQPILVAKGAFRVAMTVEAPGAAFDPERSLVADVPAAPGDGRGARRAAVEFYRAVGGLPQRALLGGIWSPSSTGVLRVEVALSGRWADEPRTYPGQLGHWLLPGLPDEYGEEVMNMLTAAGLPSGVLTVDRAAHDPVESSQVAFRATALVLAAALGADEPQLVEAVTRRLTQLGAESIPPRMPR